jgi:predicted amidohydrolase
MSGADRLVAIEPMKIAALQLNSQSEVQDNLEQAEIQLHAAVEAGAELVVLLEAFSFLGAEREKPGLAEDLEGDGPIVSRVRTWCRSLAVPIIAGGLIEKSPDPQRTFNTSAVFDSRGVLVSRYRKMHLFDVELDDGTSWHESRATHPGSEPVVCRLGSFGVGLSICYDLRFSELYAWLRRHGAQILTVPSAFTRTTGLAHWHVLLRARAIETQCWVVAAAQEGDHPHGRKTFGHALIVDPWGCVLVERIEPGPGFVLCDVTLDAVLDVRRQIPLEDHRRPFE